VETGAALDLSITRMLWRFLQPFRWALPNVAALGLAASFAEGFGIGLLIPLINLLLGGTINRNNFPAFPAMEEYLSSLSDLERIVLIGGGISILLVLKATLVFATASLSAWITGQIGHDVRCSLFRQGLTVDYAKLDENGRGRLVNAFDTQIYRVMDAANAFLSIIVHACRIVVFGLLMLLVSWQLTVMVLGLGLAANLLIARPMIRFVHRLGAREVGVRTEISQQVLRTLGGMRVIRVFGQEKMEFSRFATISRRARTTIFRILQAERFVPSAMEVVYAPIFLAAILMAWTSGTGVPTLLAFLLLFYRVQPDIKVLDHYRTQLASCAGSIREVAELLAVDKPAMHGADAVVSESLQGGIVFEKVGFQYQSQPPRPAILLDVSFQIRAREVTAIVGETGAGKTTLINLLYGFFQPTAGTILVDGQPLSSMHMESWRRKLALAGQDVGLLEGTVRDNIGYGCQHASSGEIEDAARLAAIDDFIARMPCGFETEIGDAGFRLSEGQRQRIGLARALLRRPEILILDEATNALDGLTEQVVNRTLERLAGKTTIIIIAHRFSTIRLANSVVVLSGGKVVETGALEELLSRNGLFSRLYAAQNEDKRNIAVVA
jgi:ATP-binding cassette, subfamily B, bacterial MsbA